VLAGLSLVVPGIAVYPLKPAGSPEMKEKAEPSDQDKAREVTAFRMARLRSTSHPNSGCARSFLRVYHR
jgi:hypothetical protein